MLDWIVFYAVSTIFQPYNGGIDKGNQVGQWFECPNIREGKHKLKKNKNIYDVTIDSGCLGWD